MALQAGSRIGSYEITSLLGKGGMGEVYRATDLKLKREVAIKVLPASLADNRERMQRFMREAEVLASLNHPNIAQIYGFEESGDTRAIVMELVDGDTLADIIKRGPIPLDTAINYAKQILSAFEYAHDRPRAVIHRDLKPANVKVTPEGVVKVLDFGLAKALAEERAPSEDPEMSPTLTLGPSVAGVILGTAAYMSPEQAKGKTADRRADIWSFGVLLYEMVTGNRLFTGEDMPEVLAAVIHKDPDLSPLPARVRPAVERCLRKDPRKRWYSMEDIRFSLDEPQEVLNQISPAQSKLPWVVAAACALIALVLAGLTFIHIREQPDESQVLHAAIPLPEKTTLDPANVPAISPDGKRVVFGALGEDGKEQLWLRPFDSPTAQPLAGTENAKYPFWSPDSKNIAFFADTKLKRIDANGGPVVTIADAPNGRGGSWGASDVIVFAPDLNKELWRVPASGGIPKAITKLAGAATSHRFPWFLPDGKHFLFEEGGGLPRADILLAALDSNSVKTLVHANSNAQYASGHLLFAQMGVIMAQPFDDKRLTVTGDARQVVGQVKSVVTTNPVAAFSVSATGLLAYQTGDGTSNQQLTWFDRQGKPIGIVGEPREFYSLDLSPDEKSVAVSRLDAGVDLWIYELARGIPTRFTFSQATNIEPHWSPDGKTILYRSQPHGVRDLYRKRSDGSGVEEPLQTDNTRKGLGGWSPDGRTIIFIRTDPKTDLDIWTLPIGPDGAPGKPSIWLSTPFAETLATFSPNGKWIAYVSNESGRNEVYASPYPGPGGKRQISTTGGSFPRWRGSGKEIFYVNANGRLMSAEIAEHGTALDVGVAHSMNINGIITTNQYMYDVSHDGQRFLVASAQNQQSNEGLTVVQNWPAKLGKK